MRVLLAEDEREEQERYSSVVTGLGHTVVAVKDADHAMAALVKERSFGAVITDMRMPFPADGLDLLQWLQTTPIPTYVHSSDNWLQVKSNKISLTAIIPSHFPFAEFHIKDAETPKNIRAFLERVEKER